MPQHPRRDDPNTGAGRGQATTAGASRLLYGAETQLEWNLMLSISRLKRERRLASDPRGGK
jgi:hypothetical protein